MRPALPTALVILLASACAASAACDVKGLKLEQEIVDKKELQDPANEQTVRDLRTLRDAAIVLDAFKFEPECERLVAIVRQLTAQPIKTIERGGDTDEEKAEEIEQEREPKAQAKPK
ncbi:photosystem reaction center subunit H [Methylobacterium sp. C25]|uniref:photosystem reaction center subunit H n=1 Tax=Methylobacterium sp. C25 TaxID=2721622 RepID=UPI001F2D4867|nr:photosystem reaction center subunit H [Methylobacterium sp. C25]MCE4224015.1 photosystem reaction center subunit H [Methylobacterium sp. C25]